MELEEKISEIEQKCDSLESNIAKERRKQSVQQNDTRTCKRKLKKQTKIRKKMRDTPKEVENLREQMTGRESGDTELAEKLNSIRKRKTLWSRKY